MKLTWFGGTTLRAYFGGEIIVVDPAGAPPDVDRRELLAGADRVIALSEAGAVLDPSNWRARPARRPIDEPPILEQMKVGTGSLLLAAGGEPPLVLLGEGGWPRFGRWADGAVVVLFEPALGRAADIWQLFGAARLRFMALAVGQVPEDVLQAIARDLDGAGLAVLEPGLALEV
ncbi:MAG TPA: hypothetical protein VFE52_02385 [Devosia sp.]|nr:hypothetical protein [Devosia sp.]